MGKRHNLAELYTTQKSLTEWLEDIQHADSISLRKEDNDKRERLRVLHDISGLPFDAPVQFNATDVENNTPAHRSYLSEHNKELCALRLIPLDPSLPKLRMRGQSVGAVQQWFKEQKIDASRYRAEYMPHSENTLWSTIFVVNEEGIFGEIIRGRHSQLTQGLYDDDNEPLTFSYDFTDWRMVPENSAALSEIQKIVQYLHFSDIQQTKAKELLSARFSHGYVEGYFETSESPEFGLWFIDYAPKMGELIGDITPPIVSAAQIRGQVASAGRVSAQAFVVTDRTGSEDFPEGAVLVCAMTTPELVPFMRKASAVVTDEGGILSHAAIIARELKLPCIVGTKVATRYIMSGDLLEINDQSGEVSILEKANQ